MIEPFLLLLPVRASSGGWTPAEAPPGWLQILIFLRRLGRNFLVSLALAIVLLDVAHIQSRGRRVSYVVIETLMVAGTITVTLIETAFPRTTNRPPPVRWGLILGWLSAGIVVGYTVYGFVALAHELD